MVPRRLLPVLLCQVVLGVSLAGCDVHRGGPLAGRASDEWTRTYTLQDDGEFQVIGAGGSIDVRGGSGTAIEVRAERVVRAVTDASAQGMVPMVRIREDVAPDKIVLQAQGLAGIVVGVDVEVNFHITVPSATRLRLHSANGNVTVSSVTGRVVVSSANGNILGTALGGSVDARATNGGLKVDLQALSADPIDLRSVNGPILLTLPATADAYLQATCRNGAIDVAGLRVEPTGEQTKGRFRGRLNAGGPPVELTATNGDIQIRPRP